jgi:hypothetical protein
MFVGLNTSATGKEVYEFPLIKRCFLFKVPGLYK